VAEAAKRPGRAPARPVPAAPQAQPGGPGQAPPLWRLLQAAAGVLAAVKGGQSATAALAGVEAGLRPGAQALASQALRRLGRAEALRRLLAQRPPPPHADALLVLALALAWDATEAPYEPFTLVDQAVEAAKRDPRAKPQSGFVNACLRRFLRERDALVAATEANPEARWNYPRWWLERVRADHPQQWESVLTAGRTQPPMSLRVNTRRISRDAYLARLQDAGMAARPTGGQGLVLSRPCPVQALPGWNEGWVSVQDAAAQLAAPLLLGELAAPPGRPLRLLDACAAPGGKTAHLLELADAQVTAIELDPARAARIGDTLGRMGLSARVVVADAGRPQDWWDGQPFDGILLDAPCTASGIVRRHPDVPWLRRERDIAQLAATQARLLAQMWPLLAPGGRLVYCTCSVFRAEGQAQVETFLAHNKEASARPAPGHLLPHSGDSDNAPGDNQPSDHDGFFYALLARGGHGARPA